MTFTPIDAVFSIIIAFFAISVLIKGFIKEVFGKVSVFGGLIAAFMLMPVLNKHVQNSIQNSILSNIVSFLLIFISFYLALNILQRILSKIFCDDIMKGLDKFLGLVLGLLEGLVVVVILVGIFSNISFIAELKVVKDSVFFNILGGMIPSYSSQINGMSSNV